MLVKLEDGDRLDVACGMTKLYVHMGDTCYEVTPKQAKRLRDWLDHHLAWPSIQEELRPK